MAMVVAEKLSTDPYFQQLAYQAALEAGQWGYSKISQSRKKRSQQKNKAELQKIKQMFAKSKPNRAPVAINTRTRTRRANIKGTKGGITIKHREYIGEITGSTTFNVESFQIQPGLSQTFPWLSGIANNFEKYKIKNVKFEYINISATSEKGRVTLAFDEDPLDEDPVDKVELFAYNGAVEGSVWSPLTLNVPCKNKEHFTRNGTVVGTDLKTYDCGKIVAAISNTADTSVVGELFISYEVELTVPQPVSCPSTKIDCTTTVSKTNLFGDDTREVEGNFPVSLNANTMTFLAPGNYFLALSVIGSSPGNITIGDGDTITAQALFTGANSSGNGKSCNLYGIRVSTAGQYITWAVDGTTVTSCLVNLYMANPLITAST
jgi:hypothetical protein